MTSWPKWTNSLLPSLRTRPLSAEPRDTLTKHSQSLRARLFWWVTLALIPIGIVSILQGLERASVDVANVRERLVQSVRIAASNEENVLAPERAAPARARQRGRRTQRHARLRQGTLGDVLVGVHFFTNLTRTDAAGMVVCSALPQAKGRKQRSELFDAAKRSGKLVFTGQIISPVTHSAIIGATLPVMKNGAFDGTVSVGISTVWLDHILKERDLPHGAVIAVFDRKGIIIAANNGGVARALFSEDARAAGAWNGGLEAGNDAKNNSWIFAAAPLVGDNVFVGLAMRQQKLFVPTYLRVGTDFLLLNLMRSVSPGSRSGSPPSGRSRNGSTICAGSRPPIAAATTPRGRRSTARRRSSSLLGNWRWKRWRPPSRTATSKPARRRSQQKTLLIRETHHRVKNNLQIVMSLLSLQSNQMKDDAVREALGQAQARIDALALVHRLLHEVEDQTTVDLQRLLGELTRKIAEGMAAEDTSVVTSVDSIAVQVPGEVAVPIALFTVEALMNIFKYAFPPELSGDGSGEGRARPLGDGKLPRLTIEDDGVGYIARTRCKPGIGSRLLGVFARQVHGTASSVSEPDRGTTVALIFKEPEQIAV